MTERERERGGGVQTEEGADQTEDWEVKGKGRGGVGVGCIDRATPLIRDRAESADVAIHVSGCEVGTSHPELTVT